MTWQESNILRVKFERRYYNKIRKALKKMFQPVLEYIKIGVEINDIALDTLLKSDDLKDTLQNLYLTTGSTFAKLQWKEFQTMKEEGMLTWDDIMKDYAFLNLDTRLTSLKGTQKDMLLGLIAQIKDEAIEMGYGVEKTASFLRRELNSRAVRYQQWQARRIVQTEVLSAANYAQIQTASQLPFQVKKVWLTGGISKTERHTRVAGLHGQERDMDQPFDVDGEQMMQPGDSSLGASASNIINCKCVVNFIKA